MYTPGEYSWRYLWYEQGQNQPRLLDIKDTPLPNSPCLNFLLLLETWYNITFINSGHSKGIAEIQQLCGHQEMPTEEHSSTYSLKVKYTSPKTKGHFSYYAFKRWKLNFKGLNALLEGNTKGNRAPFTFRKWSSHLCQNLPAGKLLLELYQAFD